MRIFRPIELKLLLLVFPILLSFQVAGGHFSSYTDEWDFNPEYYTVLSFSPDEPPVAGIRQLVTITINNATSGSGISDLDMVHERRIHIFIIGEDLETFDHIHPEDYERGFANSHFGMYWALHTFPKAGTYTILLDYTHQGKQIIKKFNVNVTGQKQLDKPKLNFSRERNFGEYTVNLEAPENIEAGKEVPIDYYIRKNRRDVKDLQMYLGSEMHAVVIGENLKNGGHTHAFIPGHYKHFGNMSQRYYGPTVPIRYVFPGTGRYTIFSQFQHEGNVITTKFDVDVKTNSNLMAAEILIYSGIVAFAVFLFWPHLTNLIRKMRGGKTGDGAAAGS